jgi:hypothetical protein
VQGAEEKMKSKEGREREREAQEEKGQKSE